MNSRSVRLLAVATVVCSLAVLFVVTPALAQGEVPEGIPGFSLVKYVCPATLPSTGTSIPAGCVDANSPNGADVPVITPGNPVSFLYQVTFTCIIDPGELPCEGIDPATVTIGDNQLPGVNPSPFGQLSGNGDNLFEDGEVWLFVVTNRTAINLTTQGGTLPVPPVQGCASAPDGQGARPTYENTASVTGPVTSNQDSSHYCNPVAPPVPGIDIEKATNGQDADEPTGPSIQVGRPVDWTYVVSNNGQTTLTAVQVTDSRGVAVTCPKTTLAAAESMTCTASGVAAIGQYSNIGTVTGQPPSGSPVTDSDPSHYIGVSQPVTPTPRPVPIPEPVTVVLFGTGLAALSAAVASRRRNKD